MRLWQNIYNFFKVIKVQQSMSFTRQLLYGIADGMGRNRQEMDPFVNVLQKNWYDSKESLQTLTINDYDRFDIPRRLSAMIIEKVGSKQPPPPQYQQNFQQPYNQQQNQYQQPQYQKNSMESEVSIFRLVENLKRKCSKQKFNEYVSTLIRLFRNIRQNITNQKFRILKKNNQKIAELLSVPQNCQILTYGGFEDNKDTVMLRNVNLGKIDDCLQSLSKFDQSMKFDPYKSQITNISGNNQGSMEGQTSVVYNDKLKQLQKQREQIMSRPIKDRQIKIFKQVGKQLKPDASWNDDRELNEQQKEYADSIKQKLRSYGQDPKFMNRRKQEYFQLMKKPCFSETLIRVKLPDNWIFQCKFSPSQTLGQLVKVFNQYVQNKNLSYYLYMTPPVEKLTGMTLRQTFYDKGCVPRAIFYFGTDQKVSGNILRQKKTGGFGFFN